LTESSAGTADRGNRDFGEPHVQAVVDQETVGQELADAGQVLDHFGDLDSGNDSRGGPRTGDLRVRETRGKDTSDRPSARERSS